MGGWSERVMGQKGFFDVERRLEAISAKGDPLETIDWAARSGKTLYCGPVLRHPAGPIQAANFRSAIAF
jgi:hypothetical protein